MPRQIRPYVSVLVSGAILMALEHLESTLRDPVFDNSIFAAETSLETDLYAQEEEKITAIMLIAAVVSLMLRRKRLL